MSTPRDRDSDGFDDRRDDGTGWQEPAHLSGGDQGGGDQGGGESGERPAEPPAGEGDRSAGPAWEPPGWNLPPAQPQRDEPVQPAEPGMQHGPPPPAPERPGGPFGGGVFGGGGPRVPTETRWAFTYQGDLVGAQAWALHHGWTISDGSGPEDAGLGDLVASAPAPRIAKESRAANVLRGRYGSLDMVAFDIVYPTGRGLVPQYAVTAAPVLGSVPSLRLSPARLWKHRTGGLVPVVSGNVDFDRRWVLLAAEDSPQVRRLAQDPALQGLLLGTDDGDEFWTAGGHVAAIRPDGHRPSLIEHHARLLGTVLAALAEAH